jgi:predicted TIM-barrel fold metal-dependent hydrolase
MMRKLFSVDDHIIEPADCWSSRVPEKYKDRAPHIVRDGAQEIWVYEDTRNATVGLNATAGKPLEQWDMEPITFSDMIRGCYDPAERARDLAREGVMASVAFPSLPRFGGALFPSFKDKALASECVRAWNDFMFDWCSVAPQMFVPMNIIQLWDVDAALAETKRCLDLGVRAVCIPEEVSNLGLPSYFSGHYDRFFALCQEADLPICMHIGSSGWQPFKPPEVPPSLSIAISFVATQTHAVGMMYGNVCRKFPDLKIVYSEGGVGWVPAAVERADRMYKRHRNWDGEIDPADLLPSEICKRNMWFCMIDEAFGLGVRDLIGVDRIFWECDYPHSSCIWPGTQQLVDDLFVGVPEDELRKITYENAEQIFKWKAPDPTTDLESLIDRNVAIFA